MRRQLPVDDRPLEGLPGQSGRVDHLQRAPRALGCAHRRSPLRTPRARRVPSWRPGSRRNEPSSTQRANACRRLRRGRAHSPRWGEVVTGTVRHASSGSGEPTCRRSDRRGDRGVGTRPGAGGASGRRARRVPARRPTVDPGPSPRLGEPRRADRDGARERLPRGGRHRARRLRQVDPARRVGDRRGSSRRVGGSRPLRRRSRGPADLAGVGLRADLAGQLRPDRRHARSGRVRVGPRRAAPRVGVPDDPGSVRPDARRPPRTAVTGLPRRAGCGDLRDSARLATGCGQPFRATPPVASAGHG